MDLKESYKTLTELAMREGMALFGTADIAAIRTTFLIPDSISSKLTAGISIGFRLSNAILEMIEDAPNQSYYFHYQRANILLDQTALKLMSWIQKKGFEALPIPASQIIDWEKQLGSVSHREIARLAGHGWYGRNNLLVNAKFGSRVRYATVLTNLPLPFDKPTDENCGSCKSCLVFCPAGAITETAEFNREACHLKLKEFTKIQRIGQMICGVCIKNCPGKSG